MIVKKSHGYQIRLESGKLLPKVYPTIEEAKHRLQQIYVFKHLSKQNK